MPRGHKKTHDQFIQEVIEIHGNVYEFLSEYETAHKKIKIKHIECGYTWEVDPNNLLKKNRMGKVYCPYCNGGVKILNTEEFKRKIKTLVGNEYLVLGEYINTNTPILIKHNIDGCGYEYEVRPSCFINREHRCPKCSGRLKKDTEQFKQEIFDIVGDEYIILDEYVNSETKIIFKHNKIGCNHIFEMAPSHFLCGQRCPKCANNIKKTTSQFKKEVYELVGNEYSVLGEYVNSNTKIKMKHNLCGYVYEVKPNNFIRGTRCPHCFGASKKSTHQFKNEVYKLVDNEYTVLGEYVDAKTKIKIRHNVCNHTYEILRNDFIHGRRCPFCRESKGERKIRYWLEKYNIQFEPQKEFDGLIGVGGGNLSYDFYITNQNILIEFQGEQHERYVKGFHKNKNYFKRQQEHDKRKRKYAEQNSIKLLEIWYHDFDNIEFILEREISKYKEMNDIEEIKQSC